MTKHKLGNLLQLFGYVTLAGAMIVAHRHPAIIALLVFSAGAFHFGRSLEKSI